MDIVLAAAADAFTWQALLAIVVGTWAGIIIGGLPGLGSVVGLTIFLPFTFGMDVITSMALLIGVYCGSVYGGSITAILINTPGTPQAAATTFDGYPMTQQGRVGEALGWATFASFFGGVLSCVMLIVGAPQLAKFAVNFGSIEVFALVCLAMLCIVGVSRGSTLKGILCGMMGFLFSMVGSDPITGADRFTFGQYALSSGLTLIPVVVGAFALSEIFVRFASRDDEAARIPEARLTFPGLRDIGRRMVELLRGSFIGGFIGALPGTGAAAAAFISYASAQKLSPRRQHLGKGEPDGLIASESSNNAVTGSSFIPTLALGIPGDVVTAMMMGAMVIHGITPGVRLMADQAQTVYALFVVLIIVNVAMLILSKPSIGLFRYLFKLPQGFVMGGIVMFSFIGAVSVRGNPLDLIVAAVTGLLAYVLRRGGYPLAPLVIGMVLGPELESSLRRGLLISRGDFSAFFTHSTIASVLFVLIALFIAGTLWSGFSQWRKDRAAAGTPAA
ncbi:putative tricarboxylic transport membrane protein [Kushneria avicenniae]|uniref:Putative tricarboxylic transport membrane protein n=1 Tax=Kushneria avicenniae TaxID=402385 RepID=A0A1I1N0I4_9GAMM|nr:tripartite tricarboxylate transporter permease [Kushneria avicenniae]SFC88343.1 putative tricarboxylic transport membrane protein [Kushneria avicenniae]